MYETLWGVQREHTCLVCLKPTTSFYVVMGSPKFYMEWMTVLGVPPADSLMLASQNTSGRYKAYCCKACAMNAGFTDMPADEMVINMLREQGDLVPESPYPFATFAEKDLPRETFIPGLGAKELERNQTVAGFKGLQKDMNDVVKELEARGYVAEMGGKHVKITRPGFPMVITSVSLSPSNAYRTKQNILAKVRQWERQHLQPETPEPAPKEPPERAKRGAYNLRTLEEKAVLVFRYDQLMNAGDTDGLSALLRDNRIRHDSIRRWRQEVADSGQWKLDGDSAPQPPDEPVFPRGVTDEPDDDEVQERAAKVTAQIKAVIAPEPVVVTGDHMADDEVAELAKLMTRKRGIDADIEKEDKEVARLNSELELAKTRLHDATQRRDNLIKEKSQIQDKLMDLIG